MKSLRTTLAMLITWLVLTSTTVLAVEPPIIGVWYQPLSSMGKWKTRGVTHLIGMELEGGNVTADQWCAAAQAAGLKYFLQRGTESDKHINDPACAGWLAGDEPNGAGNRTPDQCKTDRDAAKAVGNKPYLMNLDGPHALWQDDATISAYLAIPDIVSVDYYPYNRGELLGGVTALGLELDRFKRLAPSKVMIAFIETSNQNLIVQGWPGPSARGPTLAEVKGLVQTVAQHKADGIAIFPDIIGRNFEAFDGTPNDIAAAMPAIWAPYWLATPPPIPGPLPSVTVDFSGAIITINGVQYTLTKKQ